MFRRSSAGATEGQAQDSQPALAQEAPAKSKPPAQAGKGRPTPKRSQAEAGRYKSVTGSTTSGRCPKPAATPEEARAANAALRDAMRERRNYFEAIERSAAALA